METNVVGIERADLVKNIIYTESHYSDENEKSVIFEYNTDDALYSCYKYEEGGALYNAGWDRYPYDSSVDTKTPFEEKDKTGIIKIDKQLYGALLYQEEENE